MVGDVVDGSKDDGKEWIAMMTGRTRKMERRGRRGPNGNQTLVQRELSKEDSSLYMTCAQKRSR